MADITDPSPRADIAHPTLSALATLNAEKALPIEPIDPTLPTEPIDRVEPRLQMLRNESSDAIDHRDVMTDSMTSRSALSGESGLGFNWSSQHLVIMEVLDGSSSASRGSGGAVADEVAGASASRSRGSAVVLDQDRERAAAYRGRDRCRRVSAGRAALVPRRWRYAPFDLKPLSGRYLSFSEREEIAQLRAQGVGVRQIARVIGPDPSTISRELRRNAARGGKLEYQASVAQLKTELVARRPKVAKLVANRISLDFPEDESMRISHEAIYQSLSTEGRGALKRELVWCLRTGCALRAPRERS